MNSGHRWPGIDRKVKGPGERICYFMIVVMGIESAGCWGIFGKMFFINKNYYKRALSGHYFLGLYKGIEIQNLKSRHILYTGLLKICLDYPITKKEYHRLVYNQKLLYQGCLVLEKDLVF
jgi:hypothetical protein